MYSLSLLYLLLFDPFSVVAAATGEEVFIPDFDEPVRELFMWSVLMNRLEMAMLFWDEGKVRFVPFCFGMIEGLLIDYIVVVYVMVFTGGCMD